MPSEKLDINSVLANRAEIKINPEETQDERAERLRQEARQHTFELVKSYLVFFLIVGALISVGILCAYEAVFDPNATPETKRWAQTSLSALFTGSVSFVLGQLTAKKAK